MWRPVRTRLRSLWHWRRRESELDEEIGFHLAEETEERVAAGDVARAGQRGGAARLRQRPADPRADARDLGLGTCRATPPGHPAPRSGGSDGTSATPARWCLSWRSASVSTRRCTGCFRGCSCKPRRISRTRTAFTASWLRARAIRSDSLARTGAFVAYDSMDWTEFTLLRSDPDRFAAVAGYTAPRPFRDGGGQRAEELQVSWVSGELLALLGAQPVLGRPIVPDDDDLAATPVAVIGHGYWERRFGGARQALGSTVSFNAVTYEIVGVMPPGFSGPDPSAADVWLPLQIAATGLRGEGWKRPGSGFDLTALVRLAPGVTAAAAAAAATHGVQALRADQDLVLKDTDVTVVLGPHPGDARAGGPGG